MNIKALKRTGLSIVMGAVFLGVGGCSSAFAQERPYNDSYRRVDSRRQEFEYRSGVDDGRIAGKRDALAHLSYYAAGSIRFQQRVDADYRQGFLRGYAQAYRQYADNYRYRDSGWDDYRYGYNRNDQDGYFDRYGAFHRY